MSFSGCYKTEINILPAFSYWVKNFKIKQNLKWKVSFWVRSPQFCLKQVEMLFFWTISKRFFLNFPKSSQTPEVFVQETPWVSASPALRSLLESQRFRGARSLLGGKGVLLSQVRGRTGRKSHRIILETCLNKRFSKLAQLPISLASTRTSKSFCSHGAATFWQISIFQWEKRKTKTFSWNCCSHF